MTGYQWQAFDETQPDCMRDLVRTMNDLVEDYTDDDSNPDGFTIPMISFLRRDSLYYCIVMCLVILVQF